MDCKILLSSVPSVSNHLGISAREKPGGPSKAAVADAKSDIVEA